MFVFGLYFNNIYSYVAKSTFDNKSAPYQDWRISVVRIYCIMPKYFIFDVLEDQES